MRTIILSLLVIMTIKSNAMTALIYSLPNGDTLTTVLSIDIDCENFEWNPDYTPILCVNFEPIYLDSNYPDINGDNTINVTDNYAQYNYSPDDYCVFKIGNYTSNYDIVDSIRNLVNLPELQFVSFDKSTYNDNAPIYIVVTIKSNISTRHGSNLLKSSHVENIIIDNESDIQISVFPNPITDKLNIHISGSTNTSNLVKFKLFNQLGQVIFNNEYVGNELIINCSDLNSGIYFYNVFLAKSVYRGKLIVE